jgi:hypothetical protein
MVLPIISGTMRNQNRVVMYLVNKVDSVLVDEDQPGLAYFMERTAIQLENDIDKN